MNIKNQLVTILSQLNLPVFLQGTINSNEQYPSTFITYQITDSGLQNFSDDTYGMVNYSIAIMVYGDRPSNIVNASDEIFNLLTSNGYIPQDVGYDIYSDVVTHTGWVMNFKLLQ